MRQIIPLNNNWEFTSQWTDAFLNGRGEAEAVRLPHTCKVIPYDYFDEGIYQMVCGYRKRLDLSARGARHAFVRFGAAAHYAKVYLDGKLIGEHKSARHGQSGAAFGGGARHARKPELSALRQGD